MVTVSSGESIGWSGAALLWRAEELTAIVAVDTEAGCFLLATSDENITPSLFLKRSRGEFRTLRRTMSVLGELGLAPAGGTLVDVGANIGTTTVSGLRQHGFERAVACEPEPRNVLLLELNIVANDLRERAAVCPVAVGDAGGDIELLVADRYFGLHEVRPRGRPRPKWPRSGHHVVSVPQSTLDALEREGTFDAGSVSLLWIDVQGHEGHVLRGAERLTERGVPVVLELYPAALSRHGGLGYLHEIARNRYTHFVPLRGGRPLEIASTRDLPGLTRRLLRSDRFTDVLLVRDPRGVAATRPAPIQGSIPASPRARGRTRRRESTPAERRAFVRDARRLSPLVAAEIQGATFIVRTSAGAEELPLFTQRSHPRLRTLDRAVALLDRLGLGDGARAGAFVDIGAGAGMTTVAALAWHGFAGAAAREADPAARKVLELNLVANGLRNDTLDDAEAGLIWIEDPRQLGDARTLLDEPTPVVLRLGRQPLPRDLLRALGASRTHAFRLTSAERPRPLPIRSLARVRAPYVLAARLQAD